MIREGASEQEDMESELGYQDGVLGRGFTKVNQILAGVDLESKLRGDTVKQSE